MLPSLRRAGGVVRPRAVAEALSAFDVGKKSAVHGIALARQGRLLLSQSDGSLDVWDVDAKSLLDHRHIVSSANSPLAMSSDGRLAAVSCGGVLVLYDTDALAGRFRQTTETSAFFSAAVSPDGRLLAAGLIDGPIVIFNVETGDRLGLLTRRQLGVGLLAFAPDGRTSASGGRDNTCDRGMFRRDQNYSFYDGTKRPDSSP